MTLYMVKQSIIPGTSPLIPEFTDEQSSVTSTLLYYPIKPRPNNHATAANVRELRAFVATEACELVDQRKTFAAFCFFLFFSLLVKEDNANISVATDRLCLHLEVECLSRENCEDIGRQDQREDEERF